MDTATYVSEGDDDFDTLPPPYSEVDFATVTCRIKYPTLYWWVDNEHYKLCRVLRWLLLEIIVVTFAVDTEKLKKEVRQRYRDYPESWISDDPAYFLCKTYRIMLAELCSLVRDLLKKSRANRWHEICKEDVRIFDLVVRGPIGKKCVSVSYILQTLYHYNHVDDISGMVVKERRTLVDYYWLTHLLNRPQWKWTNIFVRNETEYDLANVLLSHATVIDYICNEPGYEWSELHLILIKAMDAFKKDKGLTRLQVSREMRGSFWKSRKVCYEVWPVKEKYKILLAAMKPLRTL